jgi:hypothetical protein
MRECEREGCMNEFEGKGLKRFCSEKCRQTASNDGHFKRFTGEMMDELYADALAGNIRGWQK